jgi:hypothetical protein
LAGLVAALGTGADGRVGVVAGGIPRFGEVPPVPGGVYGGSSAGPPGPTIILLGKIIGLAGPGVGAPE